ncbi:hypothetical protein ES332_D05G019700v1 [Gossypium tomentosum]|uniref:J domain-containing protein n=1 Tax=Gossypium tomentosum TaxID=34277 RepID=A0A5D2KPV0_GOSTO|nr:hypothetical protein ES332_D05G019700v1 [Gossypium tomentosum]
MDANKADALKSLKLGKVALNAGDRARALSFLRKARRLDPTLPIDSFLSVPAYTDEQIMTVKQVKEKKDYYEILGLEKTCSVEDVRKAYRKLSLKVHPDKNKAPGAEEAFMVISEAFQCLSNEERRKTYDLVRSYEPNYEKRSAFAYSGGGGNGFYNGFYDAEFEATTQFQSFNFEHGKGDKGSTGFNIFSQEHFLLLLYLVVLLFFLFIKHVMDG